MQILTTLSEGRLLFGKVIQDLEVLVDQLDTDHDGKVSREELGVGMERLGVFLDVLQKKEVRVISSPTLVITLP